MEVAGFRLEGRTEAASLRRCLLLQGRSDEMCSARERH